MPNSMPLRSLLNYQAAKPVGPFKVVRKRETAFDKVKAAAKTKNQQLDDIYNFGKGGG